MLATKAEVIAAAEALSTEEQMEVLVELQANLLPEYPNGMTHDEFSPELERRWQAHLADPSKSLAWEEVRDRARRRNRIDG
jgi:putative addiction module component (TIGR02574 family)